MSESCNNNIRGYLGSTQNLPSFFMHFVRLIENKRATENQRESLMLSRDTRPIQPIMLKDVELKNTPEIFDIFESEYNK
ncbi:hypothetical protein LINGRAHAP2_LOCUS2429, partial [Linum grandiflorum]